MSLWPASKPNAPEEEMWRQYRNRTARPGLRDDDAQPADELPETEQPPTRRGKLNASHQSITDG